MMATAKAALQFETKKEPNQWEDQGIHLGQRAVAIEINLKKQTVSVLFRRFKAPYLQTEHLTFAT